MQRLRVFDGSQSSDRTRSRTASRQLWVGRVVAAAVVIGLVGGVWQGNGGAFWSALGLAILLASIPDPAGRQSWMSAMPELLRRRGNTPRKV